MHQYLEQLVDPALAVLLKAVGEELSWVPFTCSARYLISHRAQCLGGRDRDALVKPSRKLFFDHFGGKTRAPGSIVWLPSPSTQPCEDGHMLVLERTHTP